MRKFWDQNQELTPEEQRLVDRLFEAHAKCVWRDNCSTQALQQAAFGSKHLSSALIAALATLGETHGPVEEAYDIIDKRPLPHPEFFPDWKLPGWGNSFIRGRIDDAFLPVDQTIEALFPRWHSRLREITDALHARGKHVFPNPAAYTSTVALILGMPKHLSPLLFVLGRIQEWGSLFHKVMTASVKEKKEAA